MSEPNASSPPPMPCPKCRYNLRGLPAGACPECARTFDPEDPETLVTPVVIFWRFVPVVAFGLILISVPLSLMYLEYAIARVQLGRWPVPSMDDPKGISSIQAMHWLTYLSFFAVPFGLFACVLGVGFATAGEWRRFAGPTLIARALVRFVCVATCVMAIWLFASTDPWRVASWWFD